MSGTRKRFLRPREHGAWGQLAMPLVTGLALGRPSAASWLFTAASALAFLVHEPVLVLLGSRGARARMEDGSLAWRQLWLLGGLGAAAGAGALCLAPAAARLSLAIPAALIAATLALASRRLEMTSLGAAVIGAAMAAALLPVALSSGAAVPAAAAAFSAWTLSFSMAAVAVEAVLARGRPGARDLGRRSAGLALGLWVVGFLLSAIFGLSWSAPLSLTPTALLCASACLGGAGPGRLRELGWALVGSTSATLVVLIVALRSE